MGVQPAVLSRSPGAVDARQAVTASSGGLALAALPLCLVGALSTSIGDDLGFGSAGTGAAIAVFFLASGLTAIPVGWITNRIGAPVAMRVGATLSGLALLSIGVAAGSLVHVALAMVVAGTAIGFVDTGASAWFAAAVPGHRRGMAFGIKESSVPAASLLAGLSLPLLASSFGWRSAFVVGAALVVIVWLIVPARPLVCAQVADVASSEAPRGPLVLFTIGIALGTGAATAGATFLVPALEDRGWDASSAGLLLAAASVASIAARLAMGYTTDRLTGTMWTFTALAMAAGGVGAVLLATAGPGVLVGVGAFALLAFGWGWTGLAFHAVLTSTEAHPALGAGLVLAGLSLGGAGGPAAFGAISAAMSFSTAWAIGAVALALAAACTIASRRMVGRAA
jgi:predicted MFS family arabinose efflux permease